LARRAGVRAETLNRIERGHTTPDFATVRKLVVAMNAAEQEKLAQDPIHSPDEEPNHADQG
jgi:predicted transcriptional regulator